MEYQLEAIGEEVKALIRESLDLQQQEISLSSNLIRDLDGESIDFLDIVFRIEKNFKLKIDRGQIEKTLRERFPDLAIKPNTEITPEVRAILKDLLPEIPAAEVDKIRKVKEIASLFTVATFVRLTVTSLLKSYPDAVIKGTGVGGYGAAQLGVPG